MATTKISNHGIQVQHILIGLIGTVTVILFAASIVLLTIGYMNPFGEVGLGILGGGCVVFFSTVLFLCACSIWIKNKYYPDETDYKEKLVGRSSEDLTLLKPAPPMSCEDPEAGCGKSDIQGGNTNPVSLASVSTVFSSVSSWSSVIPEKMIPYNCQEEDIAGALDSDVFSSSLTAVQHGAVKVQQRLEQTKSSTDQLTGGFTGQKAQDEKRCQHTSKPALTNEKRISNLPRQRSPVVIEIPYISHESEEKEGATVNPKKDLQDRNTQLCSVDISKTTTGPTQHNYHYYYYNGNTEHKRVQAVDNQNRIDIKRNIQTAEGWGSSTNTSDAAIQNMKKANKQDIMKKDLMTMLAGNLKKNNNSREETDECNQDRTSIPLHGLSSQSDLDQPAKDQISAQATRAEASKEKILFTKKQVKPHTRTNQ